MGEQFKIIEYPLIMLFIITGSVFLIVNKWFSFNIFKYRITKLWIIFTKYII